MSATLTTGRPWRVILAFSVPLLLGNVVQQLYQVADSIVVGRQLGVNSLAAVGATGSMLFLLIGFAWGLTSGFAIPTAQAFGARDEEAVARSVAAGTILTGITSLIITIGGFFAAGPLLELMSTPPELLDQATTFAQVSFLGGAATMFFNQLQALIRAIGDSRTPLVFLAIACGLNVVLVILMVGPMALGVAGAALATVTSQAVSVILCLVYMWRRLPVLHVRPEHWRVRRSDLVEHLRLGLPMGFQASIIAIGTLTVQIALNSLGSDAVAAYTTAGRVDSLALTFLNSLGLAASVYTAQNLGARRPDRIRRGVIEALWMSIIAAVVLGAVLIVFGEHLIRLFVGEGADHVVAQAHQMLIVNGLGYWVLGILFVTRGSLQGLGHALIPTITGVIELVARVAAAIVLGSLLGFVGVALANPLAWIGAVLLLVPAYVKEHHRLGRQPIEPDVPTETSTIAVIGPTDGSMVVDAVVTAPIPVVKPRRRLTGLRRR